MLSRYETKEDFKRISFSIIFFTGILFIYSLYVLNFSFISRFFKPYQPIEEIIYKIHGEQPDSILLRSIIILFSASAIFTFSPTQVISEKAKKQALQYGLFGFIIYFALGLVDKYYYHPIISITFSIISFGVGFFCLLIWKRKIAQDLKADRRQEVESQFDQWRPLVETDISVNIPYKYWFEGVLYQSWINLINPFRGTLIGGTPGSGKSFAILEEMMRQFTKKGFAGVVYDYKYPTLTKKQFNYLQWYRQNYKMSPQFFMVNFDEPEYSHRCNPINVDSLETIADAEENTKVLMMNINKEWIKKEGDFFVDSANLFTAIMMWYLRTLTKKYGYDVCSLPHLVALSTFESRELLFLLFRQYDDLKAKMTPFNDALENGALEQLAGQVASAGVALAKITSPEMDYILTGNDFSFYLNDPLAPKILCLGNNPNREMVYSAPLGLMLSKLSKTLNRQNQNPSFYNIDEFPTIYIRGVDNLIGTGRSNKVATILGFQTLAQVVADYGKEVADKIIRLCGSRVMGQMMDEDAEMVSKTIGKQKVLNKSYNYSSSDISENHQVSMEDIVPSSRISQFSQGVFCGVFADDFAHKESNKVFYGDVTPPLEIKARDEDIPLPQIYDFTPKDLNERIDKYITDNKDIISKLINVLTEKSILDWNNKIDYLTTEEQLDFYLSKEFHLDFNSIKNFTAFIHFKKNFLKEILKRVDIQGKSNSSVLDTTLTVEELEILMKKWIEYGVRMDYKQKALLNHQKEIFNDVYKVIALEIHNLKMLDHLEPKTIQKLIPFFERIVDSSRFEDKTIKNSYQEMISELQEKLNRD